MGKFRYKVKHTGTTGARITRFARTKEEAEKVASNMTKSDKARVSRGGSRRFRNTRISKI